MHIQLINFQENGQSNFMGKNSPDTTWYLFRENEPQPLPYGVHKN